jgi:negative regulator of sigma E activity
MRAIGILALAWAGFAQAQGSVDGTGLLRKIYQATEKLSYSGVFVYRQGERSETSRITRVNDGRGGIERVEVLDGQPREIIRTREGVRCYLPESQTVKVERGTGDRPCCPSMSLSLRAITPSRAARSGASPATIANR